jgi:hypothetical protein
MSKNQEKDLQHKSKEELYEMAKERDISQKSELSKEELIEALLSGHSAKLSSESKADSGKTNNKSEEDKRKQLLEFLDNKAFDPVLNAEEKKYGDDKKKKMLRDVQAKTRSTKRRYHENYRSAADVKQNYESDLDAENVDNELKDLGLPTLPSIHDEFMKLCGKLGVH